jgi:hypothetical protein
MPLSDIADSAERLVYRVAGLPVAVRALFSSPETGEGDILRSAFAARYWHPEGSLESLELVMGIALSPIAVLLACMWFTWRNGSLIQERFGKGIAAQFCEQLKFYFTAGALPPWYYIFGLHDEGAERAGTFIQRFETKRCFFPMLKPKKGTPLNDKARFSEYCAERNIRCAETLATLDGKQPRAALPDCDLFVKPSTGRGGRGAERWDRIGPSTYSNPAGECLRGEALLKRLVERSLRRALIVQPRMKPHPDLQEITAGALPTVRVLTCLNERREPEVMAAMLRTSFGKNVTVDNLHAGGIGALIDLDTGALSSSSNLGSDAALGWFLVHPDTGAPIAGRTVPFWEQVKADAVAAHSHFMDRVVIGWDIAVLNDGPTFIEGNGNPDLDILQRFMRTGLREHRFARLLVHHIRARSRAPIPIRPNRARAPQGPYARR